VDISQLDEIANKACISRLTLPGCGWFVYCS
jgi:hypothetical protein